MRDLRSQEGKDAELVDCITQIGQEVSHAQAAIFHLKVQGVARPLHPVVRDELAAIAKEALSNALRHANASNITREIAVCLGVPRTSFVTMTEWAYHKNFCRVAAARATGVLRV